MSTAPTEPVPGASLHGDVLETILSYVPLVDLVPARHVSKSWNSAVSSSLQHLNPPKPWLVLVTQSTRPPHATTTHAYDPRSNHWLQITHPALESISSLRSSTSSLLYMLTPSKFSFSYDPLHLTWHHVEAPPSWRTDPIVALVGCQVVVAGGTCDFEDDPLAVEVYNLKTRTWDSCQSMPAFFNESCATPSLSIATTSDTMYVVEKASGVCFSFNPSLNSWSGPYNLSCEKENCVYSIGFTGKNLILIRVEGNEEGEIKQVKVCKLDDKSLEVKEEMSEMPKNLVEKMNGDEVEFRGEMRVNVKGSLVYMVNNAVAEQVFVCEIGGGACEWWSVRNVVVDDTCRVSKRLIYSCGEVDLGMLEGVGKSFGVKVVM